MTELTADLARYARQIRYAPLGPDGQRGLLASRVLVCGCGALGSVLANTLARAGVGFLRIVDRDFLELNNLQRQVLYTEQDVAAGLPKAIAAAEHLRAINSAITIEPHVSDVDHLTLPKLLEGIDLIVDGTDNFETRFLLNDASAKFHLPWVYGGCIGAEGQTMTIVPGQTPCLRCLMGDVPPPGTTPTCDTAGILSPIINVVASLQACEALKILSGNAAQISRTLNIFDLWENRYRQVSLESLRNNPHCPTCSGAEYPWLAGTRGSHTAVLCGRNSVQLAPDNRQPLSLDELQPQLEAVGTVTRNPFLLRATIGAHVLTVFPDGRAIIGGTEDIAEAKTLYARYIGN